MDFLRLGQNPIIIKCTQTMCKKDETHVTYLHKKPHQIHPDTCSYSRQHRPCIRLHVDTDCSNIRRCRLLMQHNNIRKTYFLANNFIACTCFWCANLEALHLRKLSLQHNKLKGTTYSDTECRYIPADRCTYNHRCHQYSVHRSGKGHYRIHWYQL